jgi:hypothetical protein
VYISSLTVAWLVQPAVLSPMILNGQIEMRYLVIYDTIAYPTQITTNLYIHLA